MAATDPWAAFEHDPRHAENAALRASDGDREVVHGLLATAYAVGRLDREELDERTEAVTAARTLGELPAVVSDLVPARAVAPVGSNHDAAVAEYLSERRNAWWGFLSASVICWVVWFATGATFPWPLFVMLGTGLHVARVAFERDARVAEEERRLERRERRDLAREQRGQLEQPGD